jgi:hypothetical protein
MSNEFLPFSSKRYDSWLFFNNCCWCLLKKIKRVFVEIQKLKCDLWLKSWWINAELKIEVDWWFEIVESQRTRTRFAEKLRMDFRKKSSEYWSW